MAELLRSLQDSQLVARFQRRCGLFPAPEDNTLENSAGPSEGTTRVPEVSHLPANPQAYVEKHIVKNYFYYYLFRFSAALGQEVFYITFLPFTHWNIDPYLSRRLVVIWVMPQLGNKENQKSTMFFPGSPWDPMLSQQRAEDGELGLNYSFPFRV